MLRQTFSAIDKIKSENMSRHFQSMSRHKVQKATCQGKKVMSRQRSYMSRQSQQNVEGTMSRHRILLLRQGLMRTT